MAKKKTVLDKLATQHVGDGKNPNLFFVSDAGVVVAIFRGNKDLAHEFAQSLGEGREVVLEDRLTGVVWENQFSEHLQAVDD